VVALFPLRDATVHDYRADPFPTLVRSWSGRLQSGLDRDTHFGFVVAGPATLRVAAGEFSLAAGMYFAAPGAIQVDGGRGLLVTRLGYAGFFHVGGPIEETGRLRYIDGCSDSLLIPPVMRGDPCLNLLHLPPGTHQTRHTHPSLRVGIVVRGQGECLTESGRVPLRPESCFMIPADEPHCFETRDAPLLIVAYHPDSDWGPTHADHPMINRTVLGIQELHR